MSSQSILRNCGLQSVCVLALLLSAPVPASGQAHDPKALTKCQGAIEKAGAKFLDVCAKSLTKCVDAILKAEIPWELGEIDDGKLARLFGSGVDVCDRALEAIRKAERKKVRDIRKKCDLSSDELLGETSLGFGRILGRCATEGVVIDPQEPLDGIIECIDLEMLRIAARLASKIKPRACEAMVEIVAAECTNPLPSGKPPPKLSTTTAGCLEPEAAVFYRDTVMPHLICGLPAPTTTSTTTTTSTSTTTSTIPPAPTRLDLFCPALVRAGDEFDVSVVLTTVPGVPVASTGADLFFGSEIEVVSESAGAACAANGGQVQCSSPAGVSRRCLCFNVGQPTALGDGPVVDIRFKANQCPASGPIVIDIDPSAATTDVPSQPVDPTEGEGCQIVCESP